MTEVKLLTQKRFYFFVVNGHSPPRTPTQPTDRKRIAFDELKYARQDRLFKREVGCESTRGVAADDWFILVIFVVHIDHRGWYQSRSLFGEGVAPNPTDRRVFCEIADSCVGP